MDISPYIQHEMVIFGWQSVLYSGFLMLRIALYVLLEIWDKFCFLVVLAVKSEAPDKAPAKNGSSFNQLLGIKGAAQESVSELQLYCFLFPFSDLDLKFDFNFRCGWIGNFHWNVEDVAKSILCMMMSGPFLTGYTQTLNDWYDREIDSINEPYRPIPSGAISENEVITQIWVPLLGGLTTAGILDIWVGTR
ncbi:chlorophyll synthase, chloroplastic [Medicago truncatula]|uniref:chlorophyll synthase, chloroplastic n=1 Tax=Medicago truncatula TaxID=3880 RepID=UPI0019676912|nr:chlorophyll synthase, chloroplastic [Medicago truncatula]